MLITRIAHRILVIANALAAIALALTYVSVYVNPKIYWFAALFGLFYPFLLVLNLIFLFYWIFRWKWLMLISLTAISIGISHLNAFVKLPFGVRNKQSKVDLKVMSYNVNLFNLYTWAKQKPTHIDIFNHIKKENIDVVCLQEFYIAKGKLDVDAANRQLGMRVYPNFILQRPESAYGLAIATRLPVVRTGKVSFPNTFNSCMYADIVKGADTIRVYNMHLQSTRLKERNFNFLLRKEFKPNSKNYEEIKDLLSRLGYAFTKRAKQVNMVVEHMSKCPHPIIICGDFNDSPVSYTYHKLTANLYDTFKDAGKGLVSTYSGLWPSYRIDYVLRSNHFDVVSYSSPRLKFSDHYPVVVELMIKDNH